MLYSIDTYDVTTNVPNIEAWFDSWSKRWIDRGAKVVSKGYNNGIEYRNIILEIPDSITNADNLLRCQSDIRKYRKITERS